jgi:hypothetical protein
MIFFLCSRTDVLSHIEENLMNPRPSKEGRGREEPQVLRISRKSKNAIGVLLELGDCEPFIHHIFFCIANRVDLNNSRTGAAHS